MKAAIIGGTFNPVHIGHLFLAEEVLKEYNFDKIIFIPANIPPHKEIKTNITPEQRVKMVERAISSNKKFIFDDCEIKRGGISYTIETVKYIKEKYKTVLLGYVIGDDLVKNFHTWKNAIELSEAVKIIVAHRIQKENINFDYKHEYINNLILNISSSDIRSRIAGGKTVKYLLTKDVIQYINMNRLYME